MIFDWKSPYSVILVAINSYLAYLLINKYYPKNVKYEHQADHENSGGCPMNNINVPPLPYRDYTIEELFNFDGVKEKHILVAIDMRVFDVTIAKKLYGPRRDASRALATGTLLKIPKTEMQEYDQLFDLSPSERDTLNGWVDYYYKKYEMVGTLLPYHIANNFSDNEPGFPTGGGFLP